MHAVISASPYDSVAAVRLTNWSTLPLQCHVKIEVNWGKNNMQRYNNMPRHNNMADIIIRQEIIISLDRHNTPGTQIELGL